ncbi:DNA ligase 1 [Cottoperca gobio]|uniref:DNA ligase 1 n=1 Tax=Cottoperca gobio TaxID=56716 RepID=A0A6J2RMY0_COTGO|nr:DNA ligase 1-like [Cottoperca gobio]
MSEDMEESGRKAGAEEDNESAITPEDHQKMYETILVKEEDDQMQHEDEDLQAENIEVKLCPIADLSLEDENNMHIIEAKVQRNEADTAATYEEVENRDVVPQLASENENNSDEGAKQVCEELSDDDRDFIPSLHVESQMTHNKFGIVSEGELIVVEQEHAMAHRKESGKVEERRTTRTRTRMRRREEEEEEDEDEGVVIEEENVIEATNDQKIDKAPEQEVNIKTVTEDSQEEDILIKHVTCSKEVVQNAKTELHTAEFTDGEQEDVVKDTEVQTKTRETDDDESENHDIVIDERSNNILVDERCFDKDQVEKEKSCMEIACITTSKPEGETGQEMSGECKNIPLGICEGRVVVSQELNSPTCEETQEGVPDYNNEPGSDENTTQRFLEEGDCEEIKGNLREEEEGKESESLQNSGCSTEHMEDGQESTQDIKNSFDEGMPQETEKTFIEAVIQESGPFFEEEEGELLVDSMKTWIENSEEESESDVSTTDETNKAAEEPQDRMEELLVEFEMDKELCDSQVADNAGDSCEVAGAATAEEVVGSADETFPEAEVKKMTETSFFQESVDAIHLEQNSNMSPTLLEHITESGFLKQTQTEHKLPEDAKMQDAGIDMEETGYGVEEAAEDEMQNINEMEILHLQGAGMAESELSKPVESLEMKNQQSDEAEITNEEMLTEAAGESKTAELKPKDLSVILTEEVAEHVTESEGSYAEETVRSMSGRQDVIDEEILDLWIQTALSEDTDALKQQEGPEPGQQMEPSNEEQDEISSVQTEKDTEHLVASSSRESELVSDTEMSSSTVESRFLDQSVGEWGETQLLKSTSTGSFQDIYNMLANMSESADISELSTQRPNSDFQDVLMEEAAETGRSYLKEEESITETGFHPDSGITSPEARHLNQELDKSRETSDGERAESGETEPGSQKEIAEVTDWKDTEEADALFKVEKTKAEDEPLERTVSDSPDEMCTESGRSRSGSEASLGEEIVLTESGSQGVTCTEPQPRWSEDIAEWLPELNRSEVAEHPTAKSKDQMELDTDALDFTVQKARIAVKNPLVRPPKDPRSLLHMPSLDPTPSPRLSAKVPAGGPLGGLGIGIKLPGLGAGFPVLKKTQRVVRDENSPDTMSQETKPEEKSDTPKQDEPQLKPKWMPPRHPGFGNPLMSELKTKLKKTSKD